MTKEEALRMAIEALDWELGGEPLPTLMIEARKACKEALEQPTTEQSSLVQEPKPPTILARLPNGTTASNVYEAYEAGLKEGKAETQEPILIQWYDEECEEWENTDKRYYRHYQDEGHKIRFLYTTPPSREWVGLSDNEKTFLAEYSYTSKQNLIDEIEQALKEKNG